MSKMCMISVIVPIYKVEDYLQQCIDSVLAQSYQNIELILVNDGSPDGCPMICDRYAKEDSRVRVVHKENGGLSDARNAGQKLACGEYVLFLDGDDYWDDRNALERLVSRVKKTGADILNFSYKKFYEDTGICEPYIDKPDMPEREDLPSQLRYISQNGLYIASACNKLIRRSLLEGLEFRKGVYSEDIEWCARLLNRAQSVDFVCENFYCYRQRSQSIRHLVSDKRSSDLADAVVKAIQITNSAEGEVKTSLQAYSAFQLGTFVLNQALAQNAQEQSIRMLEPYADILKYHGNNKKLIGLWLGNKLLGFRGLCKAVRMAYSRKR